MDIRSLEVLVTESCTRTASLYRTFPMFAQWPQTGRGVSDRYVQIKYV